jgi:hypothetical protein
MRALSESSGTFVDRVRVVGSRVERVRALSAVESLLGMAAVDSRLPPSAVLFIRKLCDPKPGLARLEGHAAGAQVEWSRALQEEIDRKVRSAARPALGQVGATAEAVWFADRAELLACLAVDWCSGSAITRWWWQSFFRATGVTSAVVSEWLSSIEYVPAAFAKMAKQREATRFAAALPASAVSRMLDEITQHFGLTELRGPLSLSIHQTNLPASNRPSIAKRVPPSWLLTSNEMKELRDRWAPEAFSPRLAFNTRVLLAAALMLERAPALLREREFASALVASLRGSDLAVVVDNQAVVDQTQSHRTSVKARDQSPGNGSATSPKRNSETQSISLKAAPTSKTRTVDDRVEQDNRVTRVDLLQLDGQPDKPTAPDIRPRAKTWLAAISEAEVAGATIEARIETKLGGIFYLINAALALNLYGDFTTPLQPGIELPIWDFLALIGREFYGRRMQSDPVWELLRKLAGRNDGEKPGGRFKPPDEWRMPPQWLIAFSESQEWSYQTSGGRLIVRHPAGFTTLDLKLNSRFQMKDVEARLADETRCYANIAGFKRVNFLTRERTLPRRKRALERWTRFTADYLRVRLARALGIELVRASLRGRPSFREVSVSHNQGAPTERRPYKSNERLAAALFEHTGRVEVTTARLDVFFSLDELPVEIRLSGLDRNPGWVPAAGRVIEFHYD